MMGSRVRNSAGADQGFSLVELAIVILIIGILIALGLPSFLEVRRNAQHRLAQNSLHTTETEMNLLWDEQKSYNLPATVLKAAEPALNFQVGTLGGATVSSGPIHIVYWGDLDSFAAVARSADGRCYLVVDVEGVRKESYWRRSGAGCTLPVSHSAPGVEWTRIR